MDTKKLKTIRNYNNGVISLFAFALFSFINVFLIAFAGRYLLFSSYLTTIVIAVLTEISQDLLGAAVAITLVLVLPYVICGIFARKYYGFMIAGLVFAVLDTLLLVIDSFPANLAFNAVDILFHVLVVIELVIAVINKNGPKYVKEQKQIKSEAPDSVHDEILPDGKKVVVMDNDVQTEENDESSNVQRYITVKRKKAFYGSAVKIEVIVDGVTVATLKNGDETIIKASGSAHSLCCHFGTCDSEVLQIPQSAEDKTYEISFVMHLTTSEIKIVELN